MANTDCTCGATNTQAIREHGARLDKIDVILEKVRNRPPVWATFVLGILGTACGSMVTLLLINP